MKKALTRKNLEKFYFVDGKKIQGTPERVWGDLSGVRGDLSGVWGDIDDCELTDEDRKNGINIENLVAEIPNDGEADLIGERYGKAPEQSGA